MSESKNREGWTYKIGTREEMDAEKIAYWKSLTPQERLDKMIELNRLWKGPDADRLERTYRIVKLP